MAAIVAAVLVAGAQTSVGAGNEERAGSPPTTEPAGSEPTAIGPPGGSIDQLADLSRSLLGPTDDAIGELAVFATMPDGIPTPVGAVVTEFEFWAYPYEIGGYYSASVTVTTAADLDDVVAYYETELAASGYPQIGDTIQSDDTGVRTTLTFRHPASGYELAELSVDVSTGELVPETIVRIEFTDSATRQHLALFSGWVKGLPLPADGRLLTASVFVLSILDPSMTLTAEYEYLGLDPLETEEQFEATLPVGGYSIDEDGFGGDRELTTDIVSSVIDFGEVSFRDFSTDDPSGTLIDVSVSTDLFP